MLSNGLYFGNIKHNVELPVAWAHETTTAMEIVDLKSNQNLYYSSLHELSAKQNVPVHMCQVLKQLDCNTKRFFEFYFINFNGAHYQIDELVYFTAGSNPVNAEHTQVMDLTYRDGGYSCFQPYRFHLFHSAIDPVSLTSTLAVVDHASFRWVVDVSNNDKSIHRSSVVSKMELVESTWYNHMYAVAMSVVEGPVLLCMQHTLDLFWSQFTHDEYKTMAFRDKIVKFEGDRLPTSGVTNAFAAFITLLAGTWTVYPHHKHAYTDALSTPACAKCPFAD
jgi:hypothetical protein